MKFSIKDTNGTAEVTISPYNYSTKESAVHAVTGESDLLQYLKGLYTRPLDGKTCVAVVGPFSGNTLTVETEGVDSRRHAIYALSEGQIHIEGNSKNVYGQRFIACNVEDLASYLMTMGYEYAKRSNLRYDYKFSRSQFYRVDALVKLVPATKEQEGDPSIKWQMEGSSKYGRRMVNYELGIWRGLNISEFYGDGVVD